MPAMPFGTLTQNFTPERRERIEKKKEELRAEIDHDKLQSLVTEWELESGSMPDPSLHLAGRAIDFAVNDLLNKLEPLHEQICDAIVELLQSGPGINAPRYQAIVTLCGELERWVSEHRPPGLIDQALDILSTIPDCDESPNYPTLSELSIIRQALLSAKPLQQ